MVYNYLTQKAAACTPDIFALIAKMADWKTTSQILAMFPSGERDQTETTLRELRERSIVVYEDSRESIHESEFLARWEWGPAAAMLHFSLLNNVFLSSEEGVRRQEDRAVHDPSPPLYKIHPHGAQRLPLSTTSEIASLLALMRSRRTNRINGDTSLTFTALSDCLHAGMAITGFVETTTGRLPLQMTPSGGARNVFEAYVIAKRVEGLPAGTYHYSASQHSFQSVGPETPDQMSTLLAGQEWANDKPVLIILVGYFERLMWKYQDPNAYRVALIEAGHKGQNIALCASAHQLSACPTAALSHDKIARYLKLESVTHASIYAITLSKPGPYDFEILPI